MPVKERVNKSAEIRKLHGSGVAPASEIVARLKARGISVSPAQVYQAISQGRSKGRRGKKRGTSAGASSSHSNNVIDSAVVFVRAAGGIGNARELLSKLALIRG